MSLACQNFQLSWWSSSSMYKVVFWLFLAYIACFAALSTSSFPLNPMFAGTLHSMICLFWFWSSTRMPYIRLNIWWYFFVFNELEKALRVCIYNLSFEDFFQCNFYHCHFGCKWRQSPLLVISINIATKLTFFAMLFDLSV